MGNPFILAEEYALKALIQGMTVVDEKAGVRNVKAYFGYPDVELRDQSFPFVTLDLIDINAANDRQTSGVMYDDDYRGTIASDGSSRYSYDVPVAYDLVYQVTTYARHPRHDRALIFQLLNKFPSKFGKLAVPNFLGTETAYRSMFLDGFVKRDTIETDSGSRRLLRNVLTVRVVSEMTPIEALQAIQQAEAVFVNATTTNIPSDFTIL